MGFKFFVRKVSVRFQRAEHIGFQVGPSLALDKKVAEKGNLDEELSLGSGRVARPRIKSSAGLK